MKIAYFDCFSGISGDMILGALVDAGLDSKELESELGKLKISGFKLRMEKTIRKGISGTKFSVDINEHRVERHLKDIIEIVDQSDLGDEVKNLSKKIFKELATVEAKIHNKSIEEIHFHEVGGLDSIIDVIGSVIGIKKLGIEAVYSSKVHVGTGFVECEHGTIPVPAPATLELLKGMPIYSRGIQAELVTPTGACILKTLSKSFGVMPEMKVGEIGYGAGSRGLEIPNLLRVYIGETNPREYEKDEVILIETNLDNMSPELFDYTCEMLLKQGVLDVFMTPIFMKKTRPATMLSVLATPDKLEEALSIIFTETTTLGVRIQGLERKKLERGIISVKTRFGEIKVKVSKIGKQIKNIAPEYEDCKKIAIKQQIPLKDVYDEARRAAQKMFLDENRAD
ncbi:MAG: nickel pincer cofactor biosynthesis protein LarC [candidate division Zixibacteria bacterium]|nr:nickel pincer cofactor biosynthesis protein LarC [candidate division Zixibacteria bacterium]